MKMAEVQAGLGFGVKKFQLVWVFDTEKALDEFVNSGLGDRRAGHRRRPRPASKGGSYQGAVASRPASGCTSSPATASRSS